MPDPSDLLAPAALAALAPTLLPATTPSLPSPLAALALLLHSIHTSLAFRLHPATPTLPDAWLTPAGGTIKLVYKHDQSSLDFTIAVSDLAGRGVINAVVVQDHKTLTLDVLLSDYLSPSSFPSAAPLTPSSFTSLFATPKRLEDLVLLYRLNVLQPLIPGLRKEGYSELPASATTPQSGGPGPSGTGTTDRTRRGYYPDPGGVLPFPGGGHGGNGGRVPSPLGGGGLPLGGPRGAGFPDIGSSDLLPLGGQAGTFGTLHDPLRLPGTGGGGGGGMIVGPDHPLFRERFGSGGRAGGFFGDGGERRGLWGGDGYLPPMGAPPGARFDPVGPANGPPQPGGVGIGGFGGGAGIGTFPGARGGGPLPGAGRGHGTGDPDWDELPPPGNEEWRDSMFG